MSDTSPRLGGHRKSPQHLLTAVGKAPRRLRVAGLITLAGTAALIAAPAASASTTVPLPGCILPAGVIWQLTSHSPAPGPQIFNWAASANGVTYLGHTSVDLSPTAARAAGLPAGCSATTS
jgi:hypothetical protein